MTVFDIERDNKGTYGLKMKTAEVEVESLWVYPTYLAAEWAADDFMLGLALEYLCTHSLSGWPARDGSVSLEVYRSRYEGNGFTLTAGGVALESVGTFPGHSGAHSAAHSFMVGVATDYLYGKSMAGRLTKGSDLP